MVIGLAGGKSTGRWRRFSSRHKALEKSSAIGYNSHQINVFELYS